MKYWPAKFPIVLEVFEFRDLANNMQMRTRSEAGQRAETLGNNCRGKERAQNHEKIGQTRKFEYYPNFAAK